MPVCQKPQKKGKIKMGTGALTNPSETLTQADPETLIRLGRIVPSLSFASDNLWLDNKILSL